MLSTKKLTPVLRNSLRRNSSGTHNSRADDLITIRWMDTRGSPKQWFLPNNQCLHVVIPAVWLLLECDNVDVDPNDHP